MDVDLERYSRQMRFYGVGEAGQRKLLASHVTLCGCGALGTVLANALVRGGVGHLRLVDRDFIETNNLQRQVLFDEHDVAENIPKAEAAARKLSAINSSVHVEPVVTDIDHTNILELVEDADLILDGTDNFEIRYLINDVAVKLGKPWVYGGCIGSHGQTMTIIPGQTPCLRCVIESSPPPGMAPTCETAGILGPIVNIIASYQVAEAFKILTGQLEAINRDLIFRSQTVGLWRVHRQPRADDDDHPRPDALPALRDRIQSASRYGANMRDGGNSRPHRQHHRQLSSGGSVQNPHRPTRSHQSRSYLPIANRGSMAGASAATGRR